MPTTNRIGLAVGLQKSTAGIKMLKSEYITISPTHSYPGFKTYRTLLLVQLLKLLSSLTPLSNLSTGYKSTNVSNIRFSLSHTIKILSTAQPAYYKLISVQPLGLTRLSSLITIARPPASSSLRITDHSFRYASTVFGIIFLPHSVNLVHHLSPPSHHPSLPLSSIPDLKLTCCTNPSHHRSSPTHRTAHWTSTGLPSRTSYHPALCFSSSVIFLLVNACVGLNSLLVIVFDHTLIKSLFIHSVITD